MTAPAGSTESIHLPGGFSFSAVAAGIKASGRLDLALAEAAPGTTAAAVFTKNRVIAAPVEIGRKHLRATGAHVRAVIVNSGNANCATGKAGINDCLQVCRKASGLLGFKAELVFLSSTGIIGVPMPVSKILAALPTLDAAYEYSEHAVNINLQAALRKVCGSLADQIVSDGEGVRHVIRLSVEQTRSREEALHIARSIARSLLVKTAWAGADPNWGRILAAIGASGVRIDPKEVTIFIGRQVVCRRGVACAFDEAAAHRDLAQPACDVRITLQRGQIGR